MKIAPKGLFELKINLLPENKAHSGFIFTDVSGFGGSYGCASSMNLHRNPQIMPKNGHYLSENIGFEAF